MVQDLVTQWIQSYPCKTKTSQETERSLQKFLELTRKPKVIYTHNSLEFGRACEDLSLNHCTSTLHRSETIGIAERAVHRIEEGTSAVLLQSGLDEKWWADSMECCTYLRNIQDLLSDGKTPYERRVGEPSIGPIIPFGSLVEYDPISAKDQSRIHQFGKKVLPGLFLGYALYAGGIWKGDVLIADLEELETMDASEIYSKRLNAKEVKPLRRGYSKPLQHSSHGRAHVPRQHSEKTNTSCHRSSTKSSACCNNWEYEVSCGAKTWTYTKPNTPGARRCRHSSLGAYQLAQPALTLSHSALLPKLAKSAWPPGWCLPLSSADSAAVVSDNAQRLRNTPLCFDLHAHRLNNIQRTLKRREEHVGEAVVRW